MQPRHATMTERTDSVPDVPDVATESDRVARERYEPDQPRSLTDAVLDAIEQCRGPDLRRTDFGLFEDVDNEALEGLLREDAEPRTRLTIESEGVRLELWGDGSVEIRAEDRTDE